MHYLYNQDFPLNYSTHAKSCSGEYLANNGTGCLKLELALIKSMNRS